MPHTASHWKKLFLFCLGLALGTSFCMKWLERSFYANDELFTIMGLELFYPKEKLIAILTGMDAHVKAILRFHLHFDFAFMAGVFPGIAAACMMAKEKLQQPIVMATQPQNNNIALPIWRMENRVSGITG